jgi:hypothetical protein
VTTLEMLVCMASSEMLGGVPVCRKKLLTPFVTALEMLVALVGRRAPQPFKSLHYGSIKALFAEAPY